MLLSLGAKAFPPMTGSKHPPATDIIPGHFRMDGESVIERTERYEVVSKADADV